MKVTRKETTVVPMQEYEVTRELRKFLGIFSYSREVRADKISDDLHIRIGNPEQFSDIYINGIRINKK